MSTAPLSGVRVVDTTDDSANFAGRLLADLGADVILVEPPGGSPARALPPIVGGASLSFSLRNANKRSVVLDAATAEGAAAAARPARRCRRVDRHRRPARRGGGAYGTTGPRRRVGPAVRRTRALQRLPGQRSRPVRTERHALAEPDHGATAAAATWTHRLRRRWGDGGVPRARRPVEPDGHWRRAALPAVAARGDGAGGRRRAAGRRAARSPWPRRVPDVPVH